ncbi:MAG: prepilin-type N-terminal cleavage/methylation domain-containing protein [bacterium]|nr:prepilin-type N-terminal cleavage/methylation domain-containing protein [bacterium]
MKKNNKGFSLVELLVSVVILAIIMLPILDNIVASTRMNMKSGQVADGTVLASNIMESVKVEGDLSSMAEKLLREDASSYLDLFTGEDMAKTTVSQVEKKDGEYVNVDNPCIKKEEDGSYTFTESPDNLYEFAVKNLTYNNQTYDAIIRYDGKTYETTTNQDGTEVDGINKQEIPVLPTVSTENNAVVTCGYSDKWAESTLKHSYNQWFNTYRTGPNTITNEEIGKNMSRTFVITASEDIMTGKYKVEAKVTYTLGNDMIYPVGGASEADCNKYRTYENVLFNGEFEELENVYLFYTPNLLKKTDTITMENNLPKDKAKIKFYLVEQKQSIANYEALMAEYQLQFSLTEAYCETKADGGKQYNTIFCNYLGSELTIKPKIVSNIKPQDELSTGGLVGNEENKTRLYEVTVELYKQEKEHPFQEKNLVTAVSSTKGEE